MDSYLNGTFLGDIADDMGDDIGAENATMPLVPATGEGSSRERDMILLPGGIIMERKTFYFLLAVFAGVVIYMATRKKKSSE